jgi:hypothetical protein
MLGELGGQNFSKEEREPAGETAFVSLTQFIRKNCAKSGSDSSVSTERGESEEEHDGGVTGSKEIFFDAIPKPMCTDG